jgi:hypothetical protein
LKILLIHTEITFPSGFRVETRQPNRKATAVSPETEDLPARKINDRLMRGLFRL